MKTLSVDDLANHPSMHYGLETFLSSSSIRDLLLYVSECENTKVQQYFDQIHTPTCSDPPCKIIFEWLVETISVDNLANHPSMHYDLETFLSSFSIRDLLLYVSECRNAVGAAII